MLEFLLLTVSPVSLPATAPAPRFTPDPIVCAVSLDEVSDQIRVAGKDVKQLATLAEGFTASGDESGAAQVWKAILRVDKGHSGAHEGLRHHEYDGAWYETYASLASFRRKESKSMLKTKGLVRFGKEWVKSQDMPFRRMGWEAQSDGGWAPAGTAANLAEEKKLSADGWEKQGHMWVAPADFDKWRAGQWKVGERWLNAEEADVARAEIDEWWHIAGEQFTGLTTVDQKSAQWVTWWADQTAVDLERMFGLRPDEKPEFLVLNGITQYNAFAAGDATRAPTEASGYSSFHYAYFADSWFDVTDAGTTFVGTGVAYWDPTDANLAAYGQHAIRHAAALAWMQQIDPSWDTVSLMLTEPTGGFPAIPFWSEKRIPRWMHYGAASYCERYFEDTKAGDGADPLWSRKWALTNLSGDGEMHTVEEIIALGLNLGDLPGSTNLIHESGLLMHYILNAGDKKVIKTHKAWLAALSSGEDTDKALKALEMSLVKAESKIRGLAGL
ncbi:MAG: hypothetical protein ACI9HE_000017 [Planctomycetota bacterium]|jgi:hypothetical protein